MDVLHGLVNGMKVSDEKVHCDYAGDPTRSSELIINSKKPFNAETPGGILVKHFVTPVDLFYVRNHGPVPEIDPKTYEFSVSGLVGQPFKMSLAELQDSANHVTISATLMCAGNRRNELKDIKPVKGVGWEIGAIGNAEWTGVPLRDVLEKAKIDLNNPRLHVEFVGEEDCEEITKYGSSIPLSKAMDPKGDVILAWAMNGKPLSRDHGHPLRAVVPGFIGARSVKWIKEINIIDGESQNRFQQKDYKLFLPSVDWDKVDELWDKSVPISWLAVQSAICQPQNNEVIPKDQPYSIKGYALSNGSRIVRVDVSLNSGKDWQVADIVHQDKQEQKGWENRYWSWSLWTLNVDKFPSPCTVVCRAWDICSNTQPENAASIWNLRGVMNNAWHRVNVKGA
ncbi:uncharacterized protein LOC129585644 [Paramacrobiotus metropolitanus]|uniref:uncharacterized protein LOC129585644 n=1 Tax=Paramacrobiotus metropolitanus TaxID=2943436 RepID=UPI0024464DD1|nr:uncharacterized protein LOC129585644 [Paramacrobiotus metropolitanus]